MNQPYFNANRMKKYPVSVRANLSENDDADCAKEIPAAPTALPLF